MEILIDLLFSYLFENKSSKKTGTRYRGTYIHKERGLESTSMAWPLEIVPSVSQCERGKSC
jgi:hypothetical protein